MAKEAAELLYEWHDSNAYRLAKYTALFGSSMVHAYEPLFKSIIERITTGHFETLDPEMVGVGDNGLVEKYMTRVFERIDQLIYMGVNPFAMWEYLGVSLEVVATALVRPKTEKELYASAREYQRYLSIQDDRNSSV